TQRVRALSLAELWAMRPLIKLSLLEALANTIEEHSENSSTGAAVARLVITNLYALDELPWRELTEALSGLHRILSLDPDSVYERMDFETRDEYRRAAEGMARRSRASEEGIGRLAIELASGQDIDDAKRHVGYYLVGPGVELLEERAHCRRSFVIRARRAVERSAGFAYPMGVAIATALVVAGLGVFLHPTVWWLWLLLI